MLKTKDVYFNVIEPIKNKDNDEIKYVADVFKGKSINFYDDIDKLNASLHKRGFQKIEHAQNQVANFKNFIKREYFKRYGYEYSLEIVNNFIYKQLPAFNIDWYFLSKYLKVNNTVEFNHWIEKETNVAMKKDLLEIKKRDAINM